MHRDSSELFSAEDIESSMASIHSEAADRTVVPWIPGWQLEGALRLLEEGSPVRVLAQELHDADMELQARIRRFGHDTPIRNVLQKGLLPDLRERRDLFRDYTLTMHAGACCELPPGRAIAFATNEALDGLEQRYDRPAEDLPQAAFVYELQARYRQQFLTGYDGEAGP